MRSGATIIAAVLSVFTGGPLRCPCQLAALFESYPPTVLTPHAATQEDEAGRSEKHRCSCKTHREPAPPEQPIEQKPTPGVPCQHCPGVDLVPPVATGERLASDRDLGDWSAAFPDAAFPQTHRPDTLHPVTHLMTTSAPDRLRYCHSFRC